MKQAQIDEIASTAARLERDLQPGRWDDGASAEEASFRRLESSVRNDETIVHALAGDKRGRPGGV